MADKFTPPSMDWSSSGDVLKRFKLFRQKYEFIFEGPLEGVDQKKQVRHLLLWVGDKGLEIYNSTTWAADEDKDKTEPVLNALENYTKPQKNQILSRYQLRCLKQGDMSLEEFVTKARLLVDDSGYPAAVKDESLRDTLVFSLRFDKVRRDAIAKGNELTFQQVYELVNVDESTRTQMKAITQSEDKTELHSVRSKKKSPLFKKPQNEEQKNKSDKKRLKRDHQSVHQIVTSLGYDGQDIYLGEDHTAEDSEETPNVFLGTLHSKKSDTIHSVTNYAKRIYAVVPLK